jgi:hypothetical protein
MLFHMILLIQQILKTKVKSDPNSVVRRIPRDFQVLFFSTLIKL